MRKNWKNVLLLLMCACMLVTSVGITLAKYIWSQSATVRLSADYTKETTPTIPDNAPVLGANTFKNLDKQEANHIRFIDISKKDDTVTYASGCQGNLAYLTHINGYEVIPAGRKHDYPATEVGTGVYYYTNLQGFGGKKEPTTERDFFNCPTCKTIGEKDIGYFVSNGPIYLPEDCTQLFSGLSRVSDCNAHVIDFTNVNTSCVKNMSYMFEQCKVYRINMTAFTMESLTNISGMFENCSNLTTVQVTAITGTDRTSGFEPALISGITLGDDTFTGTKLTYKGSGEYAKVTGGNFTAVSTFSWGRRNPYELDLQGLENLYVSEETVDDGLLLTLYSVEGYILPDSVTVTIGETEYAVWLTEEHLEDNPEGFTYDPAEGTLLIANDLLPTDGSIVYLTAAAVAESEEENEPTEETTEPTEETTEASEESTEPTEETTEPTEKVTEPSTEATEPTEETTEPAVETTEAAEETTESTEATEAATEAATESTEETEPEATQSAE